MPIRTGVQKILEVFKCRSKAQNKLQKVINQQKITFFHIKSLISVLERADYLPGPGDALG